MLQELVEARGIIPFHPSVPPTAEVGAEERNLANPREISRLRAYTAYRYLYAFHHRRDSAHQFVGSQLRLGLSPFGLSARPC